MRAARILLSALFALYFAITAGLAFDRAIIGESDRALQQFRVDLDGATAMLRRPNLNDQDLTNLKVVLEKIRTSTAERSLRLLVPLAEVSQQLSTLGPAPASGQSEDRGVSQSRADLTATRDKLQSIKSQFDVITVESEQASRSVSAMQRDQFFERIFDRSRSILNSSLWVDLAAGIGVLFTGLAMMLRNWWADVSATAGPKARAIDPRPVV